MGVVIQLIQKVRNRSPTARTPKPCAASESFPRGENILRGLIVQMTPL
jgi:hypothetical protein